MKRFFLSLLALGFTIITIISCKKNAVVVNNNINNNISNNTDTSLLPLAVGDQWIYQDSTFSSTNVLNSANIDTSYVTNQILATPRLTGYTFVGYYDPGWYGFMYMANAVDPNGYQYVLSIDSLSYPYYYYNFQTVPSNYYSLGLPTVDSLNPLCPTIANYWGFVTPVIINGYSCLKNQTTYTNCNSVVTEIVNTYLCPKVGFVRMEDYLQDTTLANKPLYLQYSHTLNQFIHK